MIQRIWKLLLQNYKCPKIEIKEQSFSAPHPRSAIIADMYCETTDISRTLVGNKIVDHSDVVGTLPVGAAPTKSSFST